MLRSRVLEVPIQQHLARRMDGRVEESLGGTGIGILDGVVLLGEALAVIGVESRITLHRHLVLGDGAEVSGEEETGTVIVTMITGGYHHLEGIAILHLLGVVDVEAGTVGEAGEGLETQGLEAHPAGTPDTIEPAVGPDRHTRKGILSGMCTCGRLYNNI